MSLTDEDLECVVRRLFPTTQISQFTFEDGKNLLASNSRSVAVTSVDGRVRNLHLKLCEEDSNAGYLNREVKTHQKESFFYGELLPKLLAFYDEKNASSVLEIDLKSLFINFYGSETVEGKGSVIVLDRFFPDEYYVGELEEFYTLEQVLYCMKGIAAFHATSYTMKQKGGFIRMDQNPLMQYLLFHKSNWDIVRKYFCLLFESNLKILEAVKMEASKQNALIQEECAVKFDSLSPDILDRLKYIGENLPCVLCKTLDCPDDLSLLIHGDFQMWNIAFSKDEENTKMHAKFFDFQMTCVNSGMIDVHHFLSQACTPVTIKEHLPKFLDTYHDTFKKTCLGLGLAESEIAYTRDVIDEEYKLRFPWGFSLAFSFNLPRFLSNKQLSLGFFNELKEVSDSADVVELVSKKAGPNVWNALCMYVDMLQIEKDSGTLEMMEKLANGDV